MQLVNSILDIVIRDVELLTFGVSLISLTNVSLNEKGTYQTYYGHTGG